MFGIGSDTTELLAAREQVGGTLEHIIDGVLLVDPAWRIVLTNANAARIVRRSVVDIVGQNLWEVRPDVVGTEFWDRCHEAMRTQEVQTFEAYYGPREGWFEVRG